MAWYIVRMADVLMIVAHKGYQDKEYEIPKKILEDAGHNVVTASSLSGKAEGKLGGTAEVNLTLDDVPIDMFEAVVFVGGPGAVEYQTNERALEIARKMYVDGKIVAAICIGPTILAYAGVLEGHKATVWNGDSEQSGLLEQHGAAYVNEDVVDDGRLLTANGPHAAMAFGKKLVAKLAPDST